MVDRIAIQQAFDAIRKISDVEFTISRAAIGEVERRVEEIDNLTNDPELRREGRYLVARVLGRYAEPPEMTQPASVVWSARLHSVVARYEFALRRGGFLPAAETESQIPQQPSPAD